MKSAFLGSWSAAAEAGNSQPASKIPLCHILAILHILLSLSDTENLMMVCLLFIRVQRYRAREKGCLAGRLEREDWDRFSTRCSPEQRQFPDKFIYSYSCVLFANSHLLKSKRGRESYWKQKKECMNNLSGYGGILVGYVTHPLGRSEEGIPTWNWLCWACASFSCLICYE